MYAIIETGGKQYRVTPGNVLTLEKLEGNVGQTLTFDKVLFIGGKEGNPVLIGTPYVAQAATQAEIVAQKKGAKLLTIKYKRRKGYRRMIGHRQNLTLVLITKIEDGSGTTLQLAPPTRVSALRKANLLGLIKAKPGKEAKTATKEARPATTKKVLTTKAKTTKKA